MLRLTFLVPYAMKAAIKNKKLWICFHIKMLQIPTRHLSSDSKKSFRLVGLVLISILMQGTIAFAAGYTVDHTSSDLSQIPDEWITKAKQDLHIAYNHTSHGSQFITGDSNTTAAVVGINTFLLHGN